MSIGRVPGTTGIQPSIVDAKGDLIVATAADSVDRLAVGSANQVLTVDSSTATGLKWATAASSDLKGVSLYNTTDQTITTSTNTIVNFNSEYYDTDSFHDTVTNNSRITIPTGLGGKYLITAMAQWVIGATGQRRLRILKNGSYAVPNGFQDSVTASNVTEDTNLLVVSIELVAGDYIEMSVWQNAGANRTVGGSTNGYGTLFSAIRIAA